MPTDLPTRSSLGSAPSEATVRLLRDPRPQRRTLVGAAAWMWRDAMLDGEQPHLRVRRTIVRGRWGEPKSRYARRDIPISATLARRLQLRELRSAPRAMS
jgi:hypothetical protein